MNIKRIPAHLSVYTLTSISNEKANHDGDAENWFSYKLNCPCGCDTFEVFVQKRGNEKPDFNDDPVNTLCDACGKRMLLFDSSQHGYEAHVGCSPEACESGKEVLWECPTCHSTHGAVAVTFEYNLDMEEEDDEEFLASVKLEECFAWIFINHLCGAEHLPHPIADFETM